jgi:predicted transposase YdaD
LNYAKEEASAKGLAEGLAEGRAEGLVKGRTEGLVKGRAEGLAKGKAEGLAKGKAEGKKIRTIEIAQKLKISGMPFVQISEITNLTIKEIEKL